MAAVAQYSGPSIAEDLTVTAVALLPPTPTSVYRLARSRMMNTAASMSASSSSPHLHAAAGETWMDVSPWVPPRQPLGSSSSSDAAGDSRGGSLLGAAAGRGDASAMRSTSSPDLKHDKIQWFHIVAPGNATAQKKLVHSARANADVPASPSLYHALGRAPLDGSIASQSLKHWRKSQEVIRNGRHGIRGSRAPIQWHAMLLRPQVLRGGERDWPPPSPGHH
eukprot:TRINITY_DN57217_c0_g1_i1.p1 TRINITY_DN57217_c0_g1~~TRINITY_DN57217_c0_g1_i1.p1  ORF type:complete len:222 (+),score=33.15 TRINITY_DN57217_c0_g1_i1:93-758(+)